MNSLNDRNRVGVALLVLRVTVFLVMLIWTIDKFVRPDHAISVYEHFYFLRGLGSAIIYSIAIAELVLLIGFVIGFAPWLTYGLGAIASRRPTAASAFTRVICRATRPRTTTHWDWDEKRPTTRPGWGMYPHFEVADVGAMVEHARNAGYRIAQEPRKYNWGTEAFVADPDGYVWALVNSPK
jgi:catechol 2,3-dioxygenase-like lactoylglutathione lyase family enzyme